MSRSTALARSNESACLWPRVYANVLLRTGSAHLSLLTSLLIERDYPVHRVDGRNLCLDLSQLQERSGTPEQAVAMVEQLLRRQLRGKECHWSLGVSSERVMAFYAASLGTPGKSYWLRPWQWQQHWPSMPVSMLSILDARMPALLRACGIRVAGDISRLGRSFLRARFGVAGLRLFTLCQGRPSELPERGMHGADGFSWQLPLPVRTRSHRALIAHAFSLYTHVWRELDAQQRVPGRLRLYVALAGTATGRRQDILLPVHRLERKGFARALPAELLEQARVHGMVTLRIVASELVHPAGQLELFGMPQTREPVDRMIHGVADSKTGVPRSRATFPVYPGPDVAGPSYI